MSDVIDLDELFSRKKTLASPPEDSVLARLLPIETEPSIVIYGPTKGGKTRLAAWEATALATRLNRRVSFLLTESNVEQEDIRDILAACVYHGVFCEIMRFDHLRGLSSFTSRLERTVQKAIKKEDKEELERVSRVFVIDSVTSMANLVLEGLSENVLESGAPSTLPYVYPRLTRVVNPLRRLLSTDYLNGYVIMTAHETQLRGEVYVPGTGIRSKPRYAGSAQYNDDAEIYLGATRDLPESLKTCNATKSSPARWRPLVVAVSRRNPQYGGYGLALSFVRMGEEEGGDAVYETEGVLESKHDTGGTTYIYTPADMAEDDSLVRKVVARPLRPVVGCGPKYIVG